MHASFCGYLFTAKKLSSLISCKNQIYFKPVLVGTGLIFVINYKKRVPILLAEDMNNILHTFLIQFTALFFTIDVVGLLPLFISLTGEYTKEMKKKVIKKGVMIAFFVLLFFILLGTRVLDLFGISLAAFRIAGGILLLLMAIGLVLDRPDAPTSCDTDEAMKKVDISVFPLAVPLLSGPAAISMLIIFMKQAEHSLIRQSMVVLALLINMVLCFLILTFASKISKLLGKTGISVVDRIFGIILTAMACQFIINGIIEAFKIPVG